MGKAFIDVFIIIQFKKNYISFFQVLKLQGHLSRPWGPGDKHCKKLPGLVSPPPLTQTTQPDLQNTQKIK